MVTVTEERVLNHSVDGGGSSDQGDLRERDIVGELPSPPANPSATPAMEGSNAKTLHNFRSMADLIRNKEIPIPVEPDLDSMSPLKEGRSDENENSVQDLRVNGHHHHSNSSGGLKGSGHLASMANMREEHLRRWYSGDLGMRNTDSYNVDVDGESAHSDIPSDMSSDGGVGGGERGSSHHGDRLPEDKDFVEVREKDEEATNDSDVHKRGAMLDSTEVADEEEEQGMASHVGDDVLESYEFNNNKSSDFDNMSDLDIDVRRSKRKQFTPKQRGDDLLQHCVVSPNVDELPAKVRRIGENSLQIQLTLMQQQLREMQERMLLQAREMDQGINLSNRDGASFHQNDHHLHMHTNRQHSRKSPLGPLGVRVDLNSKHFESKSCDTSASSNINNSAKSNIRNTQQSSPIHGDTPKDLVNLAKLLKDELTQQVGTLVDTVVTKIANSQQKSKPQVGSGVGESIVGNTSSAKEHKTNIEVKDKASANTTSSSSEIQASIKSSSMNNNHSSNTHNSGVHQSPHEKPHMFSPRMQHHHEQFNSHRGGNSFMDGMKFPGFPFTSVTKPKIECDKNDKLEVPRPHKPKINDKLMNPYFDPARSFADFGRHAPWFPPLPFHPYGQVSAPPQLHAAFGLLKDQEQTEALPLVVSSPKKKRTKVTDTRLSPRAARALLQEPVPAEQPLQGAAPGLGIYDACRKDPLPTMPSSFHSPLMPVSLPTSVAIPNPSLQHSDVFSMYHHQQQQHHHQQQQSKDTSFPGPGGAGRDHLHNSRGSPIREDSSPSMSYTPSESPSLFKNELMDGRFNDECTNLDGYPMTTTLTPMHLRKAKLMFFFVRYPSSSILKIFFPDVKFNKNNTAQLVKWFSNFREFYYIQMEKYARQAQAEGVKNLEDMIVTTDSELYRVLNLHYNRNNQLEVPESFRVVVQATLREFFKAVVANKDTEQSWKKPIYKVIARMDDSVPDYFKSPNWMEQLNDM